MTMNSAYPYPPLRLDLYVAQVQSSMMIHRPNHLSTALEQQMSRQGFLPQR